VYQVLDLSVSDSSVVWRVLQCNDICTTVVQNSLLFEINQVRHDGHTLSELLTKTRAQINSENAIKRYF